MKSKTSRKSAVPRRSRKSSSAPPQFLPPSSPSHAPSSPYSPPQSKFEPVLPPSVIRETRLADRTTPTSPILPLKLERRHPVPDRIKYDGDDELNLTDAAANEVYDTLTDDADDEKIQYYGRDQEQVAAVSSRVADGIKLARRRGAPPLPESKPMPLIMRLLLALAILGTSAALLSYKLESASIGYCDTGARTNPALEELRAKRNAVEECNKENRTFLYLPSLSRHIPGVHTDVTGGAEEALCPPLPLSPFPHPDTCTPCPEHATCTQDVITCDTGYLLRSYPLLSFLPPPPQPRESSTLVPLKISSASDVVWKVISVTLDGLPGLGPVAFPPRCVEDPKRKRNIGALGRAVEAILGQERGKRLCAGGEVSKIVPNADGGEARRWGIEMEKLKEALRRKTSVCVSLHCHGCG